MKQNKHLMLLNMLMIFFTSISCGVFTESIDVPNSPIQQLSPTMSAVIATQTPPYTITRTPTHTPTITSSMTLAPTLPKGEAGSRLLDLLATNGDCRLPCIWGITPGINNYQEAQNLLLPLSSISFRPYFESGLGTILPVYIENETEIVTDFGFLSNEKTEIIYRIRFSAGVYKDIPDPTNPGSFYSVSIDGSTPIGKKIAYYMLPNILSENGRPSSVLIQTLSIPGENPDYAPFEMILQYPDQGIFIYYGLERRTSGTNVLGCLLNNNVEMNLFPSGDPDSFTNSIAPLWGERIPAYKPLEETTTMSIDDFYETFRQPTTQCVVTPSDLWPASHR
jgi:hypothetical protein